MSAHQQLRAATAGDHQMVDARFGRFVLADRDGYVSFLQAHARVVPGIEAALEHVNGLPRLRPRTPLLIDDLNRLEAPIPMAAAVATAASAAAAWGMAYVLEGSRLGGRMLERAIPPSFPRRYLADGHESGEWRRFTAAMDAALTTPDNLAAAVAGANRVFALYAKAAGET